jgi:hypothetical protein
MNSSSIRNKIRSEGSRGNGTMLWEPPGTGISRASLTDIRICPVLKLREVEMFNYVSFPSSPALTVSASLFWSFCIHFVEW